MNKFSSITLSNAMLLALSFSLLIYFSYACSKNSDCLESSLSACLQGSCSPCTIDTDCSHISGGTLAYGQHYCVSGMCKECTTNSQCDSNDKPLCSYNMCMDCTTNSDCALRPNNQICYEGNCIECLLDSECTSASASRCSISTFAYICESCTQDSECSHIFDEVHGSALSRCVSGMCMECTNNSDCNSDDKSLCLSNTCTDCGSDGDCALRPVSNYCVNGDCVYSTGNYAECYSHSECTLADASRCENFACVACITDSDCSHILGLMYCVSGMCEECIINSQCDSDDKPLCYANTCTDCVVDNDCSGRPTNKLCVLGNCVMCLINNDCTTATAPRCNQNTCNACEMDSDCSHIVERELGLSLSYCISGVCNECAINSHCNSDDKPLCSASICTACNSNGDCLLRSPNNLCLDGKCVECSMNSECLSATASKCSSNVCVGCSVDADCFHLNETFTCVYNSCGIGEYSSSTDNSISEINSNQNNDTSVDTQVDSNSIDPQSDDNSVDTQSDDNSVDTQSDDNSVDTQTGNNSINGTNSSSKEEEIIKYQPPFNLTDDEKVTYYLREKISCNDTSECLAYSSDLTCFNSFCKDCDVALNCRAIDLKNVDLNELKNNYIDTNSTEDSECSTCDCSGHGSIQRSNTSSGKPVTSCNCAGGYLGDKCEYPEHAIKEIVTEVQNQITDIKSVEVKSHADAVSTISAISAVISVGVGTDQSSSIDLMAKIANMSKLIEPEDKDNYVDCVKGVSDAYVKSRWSNSQSKTRLLEAEIASTDEEFLSQAFAAIDIALATVNYSSITNLQDLGTIDGTISIYASPIEANSSTTFSDPYIYTDLEISDSKTTTRIRLETLPQASSNYIGVGIISYTATDVFATHMVVIDIFDQTGNKLNLGERAVNLDLDASSNLASNYLICAIYKDGTFSTESCEGSTKSTSLGCKCSEIGAIVGIVSTEPVTPQTNADLEADPSNSVNTTDNGSRIMLLGLIYFLFLIFS